MSEQGILLVCGMIALVVVNIAALKYLSVWGMFVCGASYPMAEKLISAIGELK